jgi:hypothetical protein
MFEGLTRAKVARRGVRGIVGNVILLRELTGPEFAGYGPGAAQAFTGQITESKIKAEPTRDEWLWRDAGGLVAIARRHAALALAGSADERASRLAAYRKIWMNYAAAFNGSRAIQTRFADELENATRAFMEDQPDAEDAPPEPVAQPRPAWSPPVPASPITLAELRLILEQIVRQVR